MSRLNTKTVALSQVSFTQLHGFSFLLVFPNRGMFISFFSSQHELFRKWPADSQHFKGHSQNEYIVGISMTVSQPGEPKACCKMDVSISHA